MKIEFEISEDKKKVNIIGIDKDQRKHIGHIFTPSSSSDNITNAIQICGFEEAFDFWGCGIFGESVPYKEYMTEESKKRLKNFKGYEQILKKGYWNKTKTIAKKDIQLLFKMYDSVSVTSPMAECCACYNEPCSCENKVKKKGENPYVVKRHSQLVERMEEKKK